MFNIVCKRRWFFGLFLAALLFISTAVNAGNQLSCGTGDTAEDSDGEDEFQQPGTNMTSAPLIQPSANIERIVPLPNRRLAPKPHMQRSVSLPRGLHLSGTEPVRLVRCARYFVGNDIRGSGLTRYAFPRFHPIAPGQPNPPGHSGVQREFSIPGIEGIITPDGVLPFLIRSRAGVGGTELFNSMVNFFNPDPANRLIVTIQGVWDSGNSWYADNFVSYRHYINRGLSPVEAAANTFTGRMAIRSGYTDVRIVEDYGNLIRVDFRWLGMSLYRIGIPSPNNLPIEYFGTDPDDDPGLGRGFGGLEDDDGDGGILF